MKKTLEAWPPGACVRYSGAAGAASPSGRQRRERRDAKKKHPASSGAPTLFTHLLREMSKERNAIHITNSPHRRRWQQAELFENPAALGHSREFLSSSLE